jgi:hypothetical protein
LRRYEGGTDPLGDNMRKTITVVAAGVALSLLSPTAAGTTPLTVTGQPGGDGDGTGNVHSSTVVGGRMAARTQTFWTPERMAAATPLDVAPAVTTLRRRTAPATPVTGADAPDADAPDADAPDVVQPTAGSGKADRAPRAKRLKRPWKARPHKRPYSTLLERTTAKVFFEQNGSLHVCSGTVANSPTKNMVSTAGHCLSDGRGTWSGHVMVVPGYSSKRARSGDAPYGEWVARDLFTTTEWHVHGNILQDIGYIVVRRNAGRRVVDAVGGVGTRWGLKRNKRYVARGYPADPPFNGWNQFRCGPGRKTANDDPSRGALPGPATMAIKCNMTGGSSGGGWTFKAANGRVFQNGLNSYTYEGSRRRMYGPYFGGAAKRLYYFTVREQ